MMEDTISVELTLDQLRILDRLCTKESWKSPDDFMKQLDELAILFNNKANELILGNRYV